jgi:hypothetical protein
MKKLLVSAAIAASLVSSPVLADGFFSPDPVEDWTYTVSYNVFTNHSSSDYFELDDGTRVDWNENNKVVGFRVNMSNTIGAFAAKGENSFYEDSIFAGAELSIDEVHTDGYLDFGSDLGLATGYEEEISGGVLPFVNPFIRVNYPVSKHLKISSVDATISFKGGIMNFAAVNGFVELTVGF